MSSDPEGSRPAEFEFARSLGLFDVTRPPYWS